MPTFQYKARTKVGEPREGVIEASSKEAALDLLQQNELVVLALGEETKKSLWEIPLTFGREVSQKDVVLFMRQLATLLEAKIPAVEALKILVGETQKPRLRGAVAEILDDVSGGMALSQAMAKHPAIFSDFMTNLVLSGEESGKLEEVFTYLADYQERSYHYTTKARNSMIYPVFVLVTFTAVITVMLVTVIPRLTSIFEETGQQIPIYTKALLLISSFLQEFGLIIILLLVLGALAGWRWSQTERGRIFFHRLQLRLFLLGKLYQKIYMASFADTLRTMVISGIPIVRALTVSGNVVGNEIYRRSIKEAIESIKAGNTIASALERTPEIPILVVQMIRIGEITGKLDFILGNIAKYYQREVDSALDTLVALIEPFLIIFLGLGVGALVAMVLVPLYSLVGSI